MSCPKGGEHEDIVRRVLPGSKWQIVVCQKCGRITFRKKPN